MACGGAVESVMKEGTRLFKHKHAKIEDKPVTDTTSVGIQNESSAGGTGDKSSPPLPTDQLTFSL